MNFNDVRYFIEVAQKESLTRAAECLGISQPSLSVSIKRLELEIGTKLFNRLKTGVKLTPSGRTLLKYAQNLTETWSFVKNAAYDASHEIVGSITIGCHASLVLYHFPNSFFKFLKDHPSLNIRFIHGLSREINDAIINLQIDLGIVVNPNYHPDLIIKKIHLDKVGFWHAFADDELELDNLTIICDPNLKQTQDLLKRLKNEASIKRIIESNNFEVIAQLAREKVGIAIFPESITTNPQNSLLKQFRADLYYADEICLVYRNENRFIRAIAAIADCMKRASHSNFSNLVT